MTNTPEASEVARAVSGLAYALRDASPGDLASMRRLGPVGAPLFWRLAARHPALSRRPDDWICIARILAFLTPTGTHGNRPDLHDAGRPLGAVLCDGGMRGGTIERPMLSEARLARLLACRDAARRLALERTARILARVRPPGPLVKVPDIAWAVLNPDPARIARDYYARLDRAENTVPEDQDG